MTDDESAIRTVCEAFGRAMQAMDIGALENLWDSSYGHLIYQPEEYPTACTTWDEIVAYWNYIPGVIDRIVEWREIGADVALLGDAALVYWTCLTAFEFKDSEDQLAGEIRFSLGLRRTASGWRLIHCHESRQLIVG
ncbi:YybH family protein [Mycobacterium kyogaense]|uniref:YybH family protein n=1 Tax=Mycobacterium kyogaense TaxID=2212479 RepID=UPI000DAEBD25|nr:nuclear transport factor 2 family protein [Mycobacterium kyogaense]